MKTAEKTGYLMTGGRLLVGASLLLALVWWDASLSLFVAGSLLYAMAWVLRDAELRPVACSARE